MKKKRKDNTILILGIILLLLSVVLMYVEISNAVTAKMLEEKCIKKTTGVILETGELSSDPKQLRPNIEYIIAGYEVDDVKYTTKGMGTGIMGNEVTVWYDPELPMHSYAGNSVVKYSKNVVILHLILYSIAMIFGIIFIVSYIDT